MLDLERRQSEAAWVLVLIGWMAAQAGSRWSPRAKPDLATPEPGSSRSVASGSLETRSPRDLRALPGIGEVKALAIARERWRLRSTGQALELTALPGIGPKTADAVRRMLAPPAEPSRGSGDPVQPGSGIFAPRENFRTW